jgi:hypothetical protein
MLWCLLVLGQRGDRDKVGTINIFPLERYLKSWILAPSFDLPWIVYPYSYDRLWSMRQTQKMIFLVVRVDIRRGLWNLRCGDTQCTNRKASKKIDTQKQNDQLLSLGPEKSRPEITRPKIFLVYYVLALNIYIYMCVCVCVCVCVCARARVYVCVCVTWVPLGPAY